jgi:hypothetical protein
MSFHRHQKEDMRLVLPENVYKPTGTTMPQQHIISFLKDL